MSVITALMSALALASRLAVPISALPAAASFSAPHSPMGSAIDTAIPTSMGLCKILFHSSGVKSCLFAMSPPREPCPKSGAGEGGERYHSGGEECLFARRLRVMAAKMTASRENKAQLRDRRREKIDGVPGVSLKSPTPTGLRG